MTFSGVLITWFLLGLISGAIGASRNVGFWLHAFIGFLLGPIGILTALFFKPSDEATFQREGSASGMVKCPMCAELIKVEAKICKHCKSDVVHADQPAVESAISTEIYRLYQIQIFAEHVEVSGNRFESLEKAKAWIDAQ